MNNDLISSKGKVRFLRNRFLSAVFKLVSLEKRRQIFLTSLYAKILGGRCQDTKHLEKLSEVLRLPSSNGESPMPMKLKTVIWHKKLPDQIEIKGRTLSLEDVLAGDVSPEERDAITKTILENTPVWLHYGKFAQMGFDVKRMLQHVQTLAV